MRAVARKLGIVLGSPAAASRSYAALALVVLVVCGQSALAQTSTTQTVPTGSGPFDVAVNPATNKIYVSNSTSQNVSVIDGSTDAVVATVDTPHNVNPQFIGVNSVTNKIYVLFGGNSGGQQYYGLMKIDGASDSVVGTYALPAGANEFAVDPAKDLIYVADNHDNALLVLDGKVEGIDVQPILSVPVGTGPAHVAVNSVTNKIYVGNSGSHDVSVVDGTNYSVTTITLDRSPIAIAVNPTNDKIYALEGGSVHYDSSGQPVYVNGELTVIDGHDNSMVVLTIDGFPSGHLAVNTTTNKVYTGSYFQDQLTGAYGPGTVTVISGDNNETTVTAGTFPTAVAVDPALNVAYIANWDLTGWSNSNVNCSLIVIAGDNSPSGVDLGVDTLPYAVAASALTHKVYAADNGSGDVTIFTPSSAGNTPSGTSIQVTPALGLTVTFSEVTAAGDTTAVVVSAPPPPDGFQLDGQIYDISTTASYTPPVTVCLPYSPSDTNPRLFHYENVPPQQWVDRTAAVDTVNHIVCGVVSSLSPFAVLTPVAQDTTPPVLSGVPASLTIEATGPGGAVVTFPLPTATDPDDGAGPVACAPASGSQFALGSTIVRCQSTDTHGNIGSATFTVTVRDTTPPTLTLPATITIDPSSAAGALVTYAVSASDLVSGSAAVACTPPSGSTFPIGTTTVACAASDAAGNTATGSFAVIVLSPAQILANLMADATADGLHHALRLLRRAIASLNRGDTEAACGQLSAFVNQVRAQTGKLLTTAQANELLRQANDIKAVLGCRNLSIDDDDCCGERAGDAARKGGVW